jgi:hypothetical protein
MAILLLLIPNVSLRYKNERIKENETHNQRTNQTERRESICPNKKLLRERERVREREREERERESCAWLGCQSSNCVLIASTLFCLLVGLLFVIYVHIIDDTVKGKAALFCCYCSVSFCWLNFYSISFSF